MRKLRILVVDDNEDFAESLGDILEVHGHAVSLAHSAEDAMALFQDSDFDLTFMDVRLPGMSGVDAFIAYQRLSPGARVAMMTAYSVSPMLQPAIDHGAAAILYKPLAIEDVVELVNNTCPGKVVLIADDDEHFVNTVRPLLSKHGYQVVVARDGDTAVDKATDCEVDLVLVDSQLPGKSGADVCHRVQELSQPVPTIVITSPDNGHQTDKTRYGHPEHIFTRPVAPERLLEEIEHSLQ